MYLKFSNTQCYEECLPITPIKRFPPISTVKLSKQTIEFDIFEM